MLLLWLIEVATENGITGIRLTGGEPLLRPDIVDIVRRINELPLTPAISLTTNGIRLADRAPDLKAAGLKRINMSLDTLDRKRFAQLTFRDRFDDVIAGIEAAQSSGLLPVKVNAVLMGRK